MKYTITRSLLFVILFVSISMFVLCTYAVEQTQKYDGKVYPHVVVNGVDFGGKTRQDIHAYFKPKNKALSTLSLHVRYEESVATFSGKTLALHYDSDHIADQALLIGRTPHLPSRLLQIASTFFNLNEYTFTYKPMFTMEPVDTYLEEVDETYSVPAEDALFTFKNNRVTSFKTEKNGIEIDKDATHDDIVTFLLNPKLSPSPTFLVHDTVVAPEIKTGDTNNLGIQEKIGEGKSNYTGSSPERVHNVLLSASRFHGVLIPPGETFSYNATLGDVSLSTGYKTGYVIKEGRTVLGDGGGICQNSSTLFRAALNTGLPIVERHAHAYRVHYYENDSKPGLDATVYSPTVDFKFKNDTPGHILIQTKTDTIARTVVFEFYGTKDNRRVELSEPRLYDQRPAPEALYQDDPTLPRGVTKQVDWSAPGAKSSFTYKVIQADGTVTQDRTFYSVYRPWKAIFLVGTQ